MSDLYREDLLNMSAEEIVKAYRAGWLDAALRGEPRPEPGSEPPEPDSTTEGATGELRREDLASMSPEAIVEAKRAGRLDAILRGERRPEPESESGQSATGDPGRPRRAPLPYSSLEGGRL